MIGDEKAQNLIKCLIALNKEALVWKNIFDVHFPYKKYNDLSIRHQMKQIKNNQNLRYTQKGRIIRKGVFNVKFQPKVQVQNENTDPNFKLDPIPQTKKKIFQISKVIKHKLPDRKRICFSTIRQSHTDTQKRLSVFTISKKKTLPDKKAIFSTMKLDNCYEGSYYNF